jgi:hypothetical protein
LRNLETDEAGAYLCKPSNVSAAVFQAGQCPEGRADVVPGWRRRGR